MWQRIFIGIGFILVLVGAGPGIQAKVYIDIDSPGFRRLPVAIVAVDPDPGQPACQDEKLPQKVIRVLVQDLEFTGYFQILSPDVFLVDTKAIQLYPAKVDFKPWSLLGTEALILVQIECEAGAIICEAQLLDVLTGKVVTWKRYKSKATGYREVAHRFANQVTKELTGLKGAFDTSLAYISNVSGSKELYMIDYDGHGIRQLTDLDSICLSPAWGPDGKRIIFTSFWKSRPGLYILDLGKAATLHPFLKGFSPLCSGASWSRNIKEIAFSASSKGNTEIFTVSSDAGRDPRQLTRSWSIDVSPDWSADSKQMVFVSDRAGRPDLYIMRLDKGKVRRLTFEGTYNADPEWSCRGNWIVFSSQVEGRFQIFRIRPDGTERTQLTHGAWDHMSPTWSPDDRFIAFSSNQEGNYNLYLMRMDGTGKKRLTWDIHDETDPAWSP